MKWFLRGLAAIVGVPFLLLALLALAIAIAPERAVEAPAGDAIPGLFHVHAEASHDGHGTLEEAAAAAREAGARFLVLTEHNVLRPDRPLVIDGVLVVPAVEISAKAGHVIAIGPTEVPPKPERGEGILEAIAARGGEAVLAHPVNLRRPWSDPSPDGFTGFEGLTLDSAFREAKAHAPWRLALALAALVGDREKTGAILIERPADAFARYDEIAARRPVALLCGVDAHGLPPYEASFGALRLHLVLPPEARAAWGRDPLADGAAVREAIRAGRNFCSVPTLGEAGSFHFGLEAAAADEDEAAGAAPSVVARMDAPGITLVLFRDGREVARGRGPELRLPAGTGVWRAEVLVDEPGFPFRDGALWIASSAMRVPAYDG
ncbi:PHP domain-containing protein [Vulgatibacter sp.]|uniref:PHP domain-containing protein n=1 Tax=Vulgatibacter sp. TaxID=1971226 RepID=UPI003566B4A5